MKKFLKIFALLFFAFIVLAIFFTGFLSWVNEGGDVARVMEVSRNFKNIGTVIQGLLLILLFFRWDKWVVKASPLKVTPKELEIQQALRKAKLPICGVSLCLLTFFAVL